MFSVNITLSQSFLTLTTIVDAVNLTVGQNKLECLSLARLLVFYNMDEYSCFYKTFFVITDRGTKKAGGLVPKEPVYCN